MDFFLYQKVLVHAKTPMIRSNLALLPSYTILTTHRKNSLSHKLNPANSNKFVSWWIKVKMIETILTCVLSTLTYEKLTQMTCSTLPIFMNFLRNLKVANARLKCKFMKHYKFFICSTVLLTLKFDRRTKNSLSFATAASNDTFSTVKCSGAVIIYNIIQNSK